MRHGLFVRLAHLQPQRLPQGRRAFHGRHVLNPVSAAINSFESATNGTAGSKWLPSTSTEAVQLIKQTILSSVGANSKTSCVSTSGQLFAVGLNVAYLIPLIYLFVSFYIRSYQKKAAAKGQSRSDASSPGTSHPPFARLIEPLYLVFGSR